MKTLSFEDFCTAISEAGVNIHPGLDFNIDSVFAYRHSGSNPPLIAQSWVSGGETGRSCWGGTLSPRDDIESPPRSFPALSKALMTVAPGLTFLQYQMIEEIVHSGKSTDHGDYYGNWTEYSYNVVILRELYDKLVELELTSVT